LIVKRFLRIYTFLFQSPSAFRILSAALLCFCGSVAWSQEPAIKPAYWILYERANAMMAQREFGQALQLYKEAVSSAGIFPEAELGIGDVFFEEGEFDLARDQYEKAYNLRNAFTVPETQYQVLYRLSDLYQSREMYSRMEDALLKVVADDKRFSDPGSDKLKSQIEKNYREKGIDHMLFLYQFSVPFAEAAHSRLGLFYYRSGRYGQSVQQLLYAVLYRAAELNGALHDMDVDYQFQTLSDMLAAVGSHKELASFVSTSGLFADLYYLAGSSYASGLPTHAVEIWKIIASSKIAGTYASLSARQLKAPWTERLIGPPRK